MQKLVKLENLKKLICEMGKFLKLKKKNFAQDCEIFYEPS